MTEKKRYGLIMVSDVLMTTGVTILLLRPDFSLGVSESLVVGPTFFFGLVAIGLHLLPLINSAQKMRD